jgi:hypothetical protein
MSVRRPESEMGRLSTAFTIAVVGTALFIALGAALWGLFGTAGESIGCFLGAFVSTLATSRRRSATFASNLGPAFVIVVTTLLAISAAHALEQPLVLGTPADSEWRGLLFWSLLLGPWWLVPGCAYVLSWSHRRAPAA